MKGSLYIVAVLFLCFSFATAEVFAMSGYETESFDVDIKVNENCTFEVTETIKVNFLEERN